MSVRNGIVLLLALSTLSLLVGCGSSSPTAVAPPSGGFSNSNLNGTFVFSVSGLDEANGVPFAIVGAFAANGSGGITGGTIDINDESFTLNSPVIAPVSNAAISSSSSYKVGVDGRGQATLNTSTPFGNIKLDFVLADSTHGLVTEFDDVASGSGTLDLQTASLTQSSLAGPYAFSFSGIDSNGNAFATVGAFTLSATGAISAGTGVEDFNDADIPYANESLTGQVTLGPLSSVATTLATTPFTTNFDVYAIDSTHLKFIEMDSVPILSGDAYSQTSATVPTGSLAFTMTGFLPFAGSSSIPFAAGGLMVTDGSGITGSEDENDGGVPSTSAITFTASYSDAGSLIPGRFTVNNFASFIGGSAYAAYPSSGGLLLMEIDTSGIMSGAAYSQSSTALAAPQGYALNLTGDNLNDSVEVDDIAEFTAASGGTLTGIIDENYDPSNTSPIYDQVLNGSYGSVGSTPGRYGITATSGTSSSNGTLNGGFGLTFYSADGTTFPFIESDSSGQIATGVLIEQNPSAVYSPLAKSHMFVPRPLIRPHADRQKKK